MSELADFFDSLYYRFVLRDLFGKIVPGIILLFAIAISLTSPTTVITYMTSMSLWAWIITFSVAWVVVAFGIQAFAEINHYIKYYPEMNSSDIKQYFAKIIELNQCAPANEWQYCERLRVIMEACGNGYVALSISLLLISFDGFLDAYTNGNLTYPWIISKFIYLFPVLLVTFGIIYYLKKMHEIHVKRHFDYINEVLNHNIIRKK